MLLSLEKQTRSVSSSHNGLFLRIKLPHFFLRRLINMIKCKERKGPVSDIDKRVVDLDPNEFEVKLL
jgi:hypothetical protein